MVARAGGRRSAVRICFVGACVMALCAANAHGQTSTVSSDAKKEVNRGPRITPDILKNSIPVKATTASSVTPIPKGSYKTWSLFLINNPEWVVAQSGEKIKLLYDQFKAFGGAIGPNHEAVWFWSGVLDAQFHERVDVGRAAAFCTKLNLPPSGGPYILVTSDYPGRGLTSDPSSFLPTPLKNYSTVSLNNKSADEILQLLTRLADKITADRLADLDSGSNGYWSAWQQAFEGIRDFLSNRQMTVSIKTPFSDIQIR